MQRLVMIPAPGERVLRFVGDQLSFQLRYEDGSPLPLGWRAALRTNLGRATLLRHEIINAHTGQFNVPDAAWRDIPMQPTEGEWALNLAFTEVGYFRAKAYAVDPKGRQHWPEGYDLGVSVHPNQYRTLNTIYCAFVRMFGDTRTAASTKNEKLEAQLMQLDQRGYTVIPPSGKFRDLIRHLPHIIDTLNCRILHLLPVNPTPTVYARFGRFGSPYAVRDLTAIDPALVEFDRRTTGVDQFRELTYATHLRGGRIFLDVVINHTGWGSTLQENHPEWYLRSNDGSFVCPGAWETIWEDLSELDHRNPALWEHLAEVFLVWCGRGVDGFRCDAGYKIPVPAWKYITARVLEEFPETIFLLEGLGGSWEATENLLTEGGMQWAYSELFQNYSGREVATYLDYCLRQSRRAGIYVHYSETHDNERLALLGRNWSLLRNHLCGLTSVSGGFGFTCGVEWLASEKIQVHQSRGLAWGNQDNIVAELARLNRLLANHPCFFDSAVLTRLSPVDSPVYALSRVSQEGKDRVLVLVNTDAKNVQSLLLDKTTYEEPVKPAIDLLGQAPPATQPADDEQIEFTLKPGACFCLATTVEPIGLSGDLYRQLRAQAAWAITAVSRRFRARDIGAYNWRELAALIRDDPGRFLAALDHLNPDVLRGDLVNALEKAMRQEVFPRVATWKLIDRRRISLVPLDHWLLLRDIAPFRALLTEGSGRPAEHVHSIQIDGGHIACFAPVAGKSGDRSIDASLRVERYAAEQQQVEAPIRFVGSTPDIRPATAKSTLVLLTNGLGGMARLSLDLGVVQSKYDCVLGANLHSDVPIDRHIFIKRVRMWISADGFVSQLNRQNLEAFAAGPPAQWRFTANAGDGRTVQIGLTVDMLAGRNTTVLRVTRLMEGDTLPEACDVRAIARFDIEDRNFHTETYRTPGAEHHFSAHCQPLPQQIGFGFTPSPERQVRVFSDSGAYHHEAEWSENIPHPVEQSRGQIASGASYSPGWFDLPLSRHGQATMVACADAEDPRPELIQNFIADRNARNELAQERAGLPLADTFGRQLALAVQAFVVRRGRGQTVIAGYPWFLDWGRDSLICARGLLAAGMDETVRQLLVLFGQFAENGTLPNSIYGEDATNRDTSDAPLWYGVVCEECSKFKVPGSTLDGTSFYGMVVDKKGRTIVDVLRSIALGYCHGTPNGIRMDAASALIWSPSHFTWMDTNHPAGTPREGYPVEIQVLWIRLLRQLERLEAPCDGERWADLADRAQDSLLKLFWLEERGYLADLLIAKPNQPAREAVVDTALRSNCIFAVSLDLLTGERAKRCVEAALNYLVVPGALRSLAPLPVSPPLPIHSPDGVLLNDPIEPYQGRYEGDEDTRRKLAYHNGTAWLWALPSFCEALVKAWESEPAAVSTAKSYLSSLDRLLAEGCVGQLPEIVDGDAPHTQRGCDAQAWSVTEALRVWKQLNALPTSSVSE